MSPAIQLDLFEEVSEYSQIKMQISTLRESQDKQRRRIFSVLNDLENRICELENENLSLRFFVSETKKRENPSHLSEENK